MDTRSDVLWRINNEYRKRLTQAQTFLDLLEQMMLSHGSDSYTLEALHYARDQVSALTNEHRDWRYSYYYDSPQSKRMVQDDRAINQALSRFSRMRSAHQALLSDLYNLFGEMPRPDPALTRVPNGDLWSMTHYAIYDLLEFGDYLSELQN